MTLRGGEYAVEEIARAWFVKMRGEDGAALRPEFDEWLAAAPAHRAAYERISRAMMASALLKSSSRFGSDEARRRRAGTRGRRWPWAAAATGALFVAAAVGVVSLSRPGTGGFAPSAHASEPLTTQRGEIRTFTLPDGSTAILDTESRLELRYSAGERRVRLAKGRVRLTIAAEGRPFIAEAGDHMAEAGEAVIDLSVDKARTEIMLLSGPAATLRTAARGADHASGRAITAGERISISLSAPAARRLPASAAPTGADWPSGWAEYDSIPLGSLVAEANRYAIQPIIVDDAVAALAVSGRFNLRDTDAFARRISALFGLAPSERPDGLHLTKQ